MEGFGGLKHAEKDWHFGVRIGDDRIRSFLLAFPPSFYKRLIHVKQDLLSGRAPCHGRRF